MPIELRDIALLSGVSVAHAWQITRFAIRVGGVRGKYKIDYPKTTGNEEFERYYRAHQNTVEMYPVFSASLWAAGLFFHQVPAALAGVLYIYGRQVYFNGYIVSVKDRIPGFNWVKRSLMASLGMFLLGIGHMAIEEFAGINIRQEYLKF